MLGAWWKDYQSECEAILGPQVPGPYYRTHWTYWDGDTEVRGYFPTQEMRRRRIQAPVKVSDESWGYAGLGIAAAMALVAAYFGWLLEFAGRVH